MLQGVQEKEGLHMVYGISSLASVLISVMVVLNGELSDYYGAYTGAAIVHFAGLVLVSLFVLIRRENPFARRGLRWTAYLGGAAGATTTLMSNLAYGHISVSAIVALSLLGQALAALMIDCFGLFGMRKKQLNPGALLGLLCTCVGCAVLLRHGGAVVWAIVLTLLNGALVAVSRYVNAQLSANSTVLVGTWFNYSVGLATALVLMALTRTAVSAVPSAPVWVYLGGMIGVVSVSLSSWAAPKLPAFRLTLILIAGQLLTGVAIDALFKGNFSATELIGGGAVLFGLFLNVWMDERGQRPKHAQQNG